MALIPTRQIPLDSFQSSFSKFQGSHLSFFRYSSSIPLKSQYFYCNSPSNTIRPRKSSTFATDSRNLCSTTAWFYKWNKPNNENRPKPPQALLNYRGDDNYSGNASGSTMEKIVEKLKRHGYVEGGSGDENKERVKERVIEKGSVEDILHVEEGLLPNSRGGFSKESPLGMETVFGSDGEVMFPWEKKKKEENQEDVELETWTARKKSRTTLAELTLPESELRRLKMLSWQLKTKTKIGGRGVTQEVVDAIHEKWRTSEIVRVKVQGAPALNMKRMHEILEKRTGGLVIWRSGSSLSLYRGVSYEDPSIQQNKKEFRRNAIPATALPAGMGKTAKGSSSGEVHSPQTYTDPTVKAGEDEQREMLMEAKYEDEIGRLLDELGPRYTDWPGPDPLPVDADMLPGIVPGYQPPYRILPYGVRPTISTKEATSLRRLARTLPPHFALGRSRQLQGLAVAMVKLWEKSSIAKIALKRGVQLTTSERMAEDIKKLTGSMLLSRNKDFLVFYRGKNFLSSDLTEVLLERERLAKSLQDEEEQARLRASVFVASNVETMEQSRSDRTLEETLNADARWGKRLDGRHKEKIMREAEIARHAVIVRKLERKLGLAERKLMKAERDLFKVEAFLKPSDRQADPESITDEERFMFRKLGLRMKAFLLLGRRGVFDGTVENMHLHWKYRELVKIILKAPNFEEVKKIALSLEAESGGVLVSVDKVSKGYAIVVFRGKDYQRPSKMRPGNLLTKRKALARSIEIQRHEALQRHVSALQDKVELIRSQIHEVDTAEGQGAEELYDKLDSAYPTEDDDDDTEEEGDDAYLETYNSENEDDEPDITVHSLLPETNFPYSSQKQNPDTEKLKEDVSKLHVQTSYRGEQEQQEEVDDEEEEGADDYEDDSESDV